MIQELVSIIMPVKNVGAFIEDCLLSILSQTYMEWELLIVNDHSTDNTAELIKAFTLKNSRISLFQNEESGIIPALQLAFKNSNGRYITRMDGDDLMPKDRLKKMVEALQNAPPKSVVTGKVEYFGKQVSPGYKQYENWINELVETDGHWQNVYRECVVASPNWLARKDELTAIDAFNGLEYPEDYDLVFKWYANGFSVQSLAHTTLLWREHPLRTSRNSEHYQQAAFFRLKIKRFLQIDFQHPLVLWGDGEKARLTASILKEKKIDFEWMVLKPNRFPNGIQGIKVLGFREIEKQTMPKLLIAVFPEPKEMKQLKDYLEHIQLQEGVDYWFL
jgi:glycosyltransferase involved in cell wall biosynthesis